MLSSPLGLTGALIVLAVLVRSAVFLGRPGSRGLGGWNRLGGFSSCLPLFSGVAGVCLLGQFESELESTTYRSRLRGNQPLRRSPVRADRSIPAGAGEPPPLCPRSPAPTVYPRWRGGTSCWPSQVAPVIGLSPLARGNRCQAFVPPAHVGSIPAGAGEPAAGWHGHRRLAVYPRWRGGTRKAEVIGHDYLGLSPLARGNRTFRAVFATLDGSIPAGAGEPNTVDTPLSNHTVYPRWRGGTLTLVV